MALTETTTARLEIAHDGTVFVNNEVTIFRNGIQVATENNRTGYSPGSDVSNLSLSIQAVCTATWTDEVIAAWNEKLQLSAIPTELRV